MSGKDIRAKWASLSGLEFLQAMIASEDASAMGNLLNQNVVEAGDGFAVVVGVPEEKFYNTMGRVHGGFAATLIDTGLGCAVMSKLGKGVGYGTVELKVNYVRRVDVETGPLTCRAIVLHAGRTMLTAEAKVADQAGVLYAHGSGTFLVYPK
jgi:acyl-CoA thioesterase